MIEKTEWEVIDAPAPDERDAGAQTPHGRPHLLGVLLGPWWRWKIASLAIVGSAVLLFFAAFAGVIVLLLFAAGLLALMVNKVRLWINRNRKVPGNRTPMRS